MRYPFHRVFFCNLILLSLGAAPPASAPATQPTDSSEEFRAGALESLQELKDAVMAADLSPSQRERVEAIFAARKEHLESTADGLRSGRVTGKQAMDDLAQNYIVSEINLMLTRRQVEDWEQRWDARKRTPQEQDDDAAMHKTLASLRKPLTLLHCSEDQIKQAERAMRQVLSDARKHQLELQISKEKESDAAIKAESERFLREKMSAAVRGILTPSQREIFDRDVLPRMATPAATQPAETRPTSPR